MAIKTYPKGSKKKLSENFSVWEFSCHGQGCCTTTLVDDGLVEILQKIRDHFRAKVTITSGHRCAVHNKSIGGATASRHMAGRAADIVVEGVPPREVAKYAESIGVPGIGLYETKKDGYFTHVDTGPRKAFWYGQAQEPRSTFGGASLPKPTAPAEPAEDYTLEQFIRDVQMAIGAAVDGVAGPETIGKTVTLSARHNRTHKAVEAVQRRLLALGYTEVGKPDGVAGPKFTAAVKRFQRRNGCQEDGEITAGFKTWRKLLGMA